MSCEPSRRNCGPTLRFRDSSRCNDLSVQPHCPSQVCQVILLQTKGMGCPSENSNDAVFVALSLDSLPGLGLHIHALYHVTSQFLRPQQVVYVSPPH